MSFPPMLLVVSAAAEGAHAHFQAYIQPGLKRYLSLADRTELTISHKVGYMIS